MKPVAIVIENAVDVTGSLKSVLRSCSTLAEHFEFVFVLPRRSRARHFVENFGFPVRELPFIEIARSWKTVFYLPALMLNALRLRSVLRRSGASLIVVNDFYNMVPPVYRMFGGKVPYVAYVRFVPDRFPAALVGLWRWFHLRNAETLIAVSMAVLKQLRPEEKVQLVYNEIPVEEEFRLYPFNPDSRTILYLANYIEGKGHGYAVEAFARVSGEFPGWKLRFVGGDMGLAKNRHYRKKLEQLANDSGVSSATEFRGFADDVVTEYRQAALVLNFSNSESFSLTCIEAMYTGRPVIATRSGGPEEIITNNVDGLLVDIGNVDQMAAAMRRLLQSPELRERFGMEAHKSVSGRFSLANTAYKLLEIYKQAILSRRNGFLL